VQIGHAIGTRDDWQFECDYQAIFKNRKLSEDQRKNLPEILWSNYLKDLATVIVKYCEDDINKSACRDEAKSRVVEFKFAAEKKDGCYGSYQQLYWNNGSLVIQCLPEHFSSNMSEISSYALDVAFNLTVDERCDYKQTATDPSMNRLLPLVLRREFRDFQKKWKGSLGEIATALGQPHSFEMDIVAIFRSVTNKNYRFRLASLIYESYVKNVAAAITKMAATAEVSCSVRENFVPI